MVPESTSAPQQRLLRRVLFSSPATRLRSGWRLLIHALLCLTLAVAFALPFAVLNSLGRLPLGAFEPAFSSGVVGLAVVLGTWMARRGLDRRSLTSLGLQRSPHAVRDLWFGIGLGGVLMGLIFVAESAAGWLRVESFAWQTESAAFASHQLVLVALFFVAVGVYEELLSRGYQLQNLAEGLNWPLAIVLSSAIFALLHAGNPHATWVSTLGIFLAGILFSYGFLRTRQLWLPIGLHMGWNFFQGPVLGFPVSGLETYRLIRHVVDGPEWITGGAFGPEAGLVSIAAMALGAVLIRLWTAGRSAAN